MVSLLSYISAVSVPHRRIYGTGGCDATRCSQLGVSLLSSVAQNILNNVLLVC